MLLDMNMSASLQFVHVHHYWVNNQKWWIKILFHELISGLLSVAKKQNIYIETNNFIIIIVQCC